MYTGLTNGPLYALTVEEFTQLLDERINAALKSGKTLTASPSSNLVYGIRGIEKLFGVSLKDENGNPYMWDHVSGNPVEGYHPDSAYMRCTL